MSVSAEKYLILGGTKEASELAVELHKQGKAVITSLAGRTKEPEPVSGDVRIGGFGGVEGLVEWIKQNDITHIIDATHPFARQISANAAQAAKESGVNFDVRQRAPWTKIPEDNWISVNNIESAAEAIPTASRVLLALGSQYITLFEKREDVHFIVRMVDGPQIPLSFAKHTLVLGKPKMDVPAERDLLEQHKCTHIVCRNSGGRGAYAKIEAARELQLPVIMIERPDLG